MKNTLVMLASAAVIGLSIALVFVAYISVDLPDLDQIASRRINQSTKIYDRTGEVLLFEIHGEEKRTVIPFDQIPDMVKQATIAAEDKNFYEHPAFDWKALARSVWIDITQNKRVGGSTITQQLAKNVFLSSDRTISRKVKELIIALKLEQRFSKDEILGLYLNQIPYGGNSYGIEAAAQTYFNKRAADLTLAETSMLVALPQAPSYYSPYGTHGEALAERQKYVLDQMEELGYVTKEERQAAVAEVLTLAPQSTTIKAPHFVMMVIDQLQDIYGEDMLQNGGLRVMTTLNWEMQQEAERAVKDGAERNWELYKGRNAALVAQEAATGQILALVGSYDYFDVENEGNFNVAYQGLRQPGSAFKPFVYATAFEKGYTPETILFDVPTEFDTRGGPEDTYSPHNFDNKYRGPISMRTSLAQSVNVTAVKTLYLAGIDETLKTAADFGITTLTDRSRFGLSLVLGGGEVRLTELVNAYSVFARDGEGHKQQAILKVTDSEGRVLQSYRDETGRAIEPQYARLVNDILSDTEARRGLFISSLSLTVFPNYQVAVKTGTTNDYVDAWTVGYTPELVVGVWAGNNRREPMEQQGSSILAALPIWSDFFRKVVADYEPAVFPRPEPIATEKPILKGDYLFGKQIHNILYYVDKDNPAGPVPQNPARDPQFEKWEAAVMLWARANLADFDLYNKTPLYDYRSQGTGAVVVTVTAPESGTFVKGQTTLTAKITAPSQIKKLELKINGVVRDTRTGEFGTSYEYKRVITAGELGTQNKVTVGAWSEDGQGEAEVILYK